MGNTSFRRRLVGVVLAGVTALASTACGLTGGDDGGGDGTVQLRFSWWGNNDRAAATQKVIEAFQAANPNIRVKGEFADFNGYFDKLATQVASNDAPDVITMGGAYPREYGDRGALLDLSTVKGELNMDRLDKAALENGYFSGKQYGVPSGVNTYALAADPEVFAKAGVPLPDDSTWTWDDFVRIAQQLAAKLPEGSYGIADPTSMETLTIFARQRGEDMYTADGKLAISKQTLVDWWTMATGLRDAKAAPPAQVTAELVTQTGPEQTLIGRGLAGMQFQWSNLLTALRKASGHQLIMLRAPGESTRPGMWLQASQLYTINARTKHPKEAAKFVDFLVNSEAAGKIILIDRGVPANSQVRDVIQPDLDADSAAAADFVAKAAPLVGPPGAIGPTGSTDSVDILNRLNAEVLFNRMTPEKAADEFLKQLTAAITK
jgi:multiple sugar transport system substrate-binding protein